jgi:hypothetical protein
MKKSLFLLLVVLIIAVLAGCNDNTTSPTTPTQANTPTPTAPASDGNTPSVTQPANLVEISGNVIAFNEQGAQIEKAETWESERGGNVQVTGEDDNEIINIYWSADTVFELNLTTINADGTDSMERRAADVNDVDENVMLDVWGAQEGTRFVVQRVVIWRSAN